MLRFNSLAYQCICLWFLDAFSYFWSIIPLSEALDSKGTVLQIVRTATAELREFETSVRVRVHEEADGELYTSADTSELRDNSRVR